jgi:CheY-like chemotaxis protein
VTTIQEEAMHVVIVEDDHLQTAPLTEHLNAAFAPVTVEALASEEDFRTALPRFAQRPPDLVVMDVMLRWNFPRPNRPKPPADVVEGGYYRAGLRCVKLMLADEALRSVPVVLHTILEVGDLERDGETLPPNTTYVGKTSDLDVLVRHIKGLLRHPARYNPGRPAPTGHNGPLRS